MSGEMRFCLVAVPVVVVSGLSKGGFSGLGRRWRPHLVARHFAGRGHGDRAADPPQVSVWAFRRDCSVRNLLILTPSAMIGIAVGWLIAARVGDGAVRLVLGVDFQSFSSSLC